MTDLATRRALRDGGPRVRSSFLHWVAGSAFYIAHAKDGDDAACGARGDLILAPPGVPLCVECYPLVERAT